MDLIESIKFIAEELARFNFKHEITYSIHGFLGFHWTGEPNESEGVTSVSLVVSDPSGEYVASETRLALSDTLQGLAKNLLGTREERWEKDNLSDINIPLVEDMNVDVQDLKRSLNIIVEELDESGTRSHYPYILSIKTCEIPPDMIPGFEIEVQSEVYGEIATAMELSLLDAFLKMGGHLMSSREERWNTEGK